MNKSVKFALISAISVSFACASGYRIPEQSLGGTGKSGANIASSNGADASYYNPANMAFIEDGSQLELALTYIHLTSINYTDVLPLPSLQANSEKENFLAPAFHYISPMVKDWRFGLSITAPGGLSKRWEDPYAKAYAQKFALKIVELNPTASYKINDKFAIGFGLRAVYTKGTVQSDTTVMLPQAGKTRLKRDMEGDSIDFGYNLALSYKPIEQLTLSTTYRSKVNLSVEGNADISGTSYGASVDIPLPATLDISIAYDFGKTVLEATYERTFWSSYDKLDFNYDRPMQNPIFKMAFDDVKVKNWKDVDAFRLGVSHELTDELTILGGFSIDKNPAPEDTLGFELPDSDARLYSAGLLYKVSKNMTLGLSYLYDVKKNRSVNSRQNPKDPKTGFNGNFKDGAAHLVSASFMYKF